MGKHEWLSMMRFVLFNAFAAWILTLSWVEGYIGLIVAADMSGISLLIAVVFLYGWFEACRASYWLSAQMGAWFTKTERSIANVYRVAESLVFLGLIGTVIGFIVALSGVDPATVTDPSSIAGIVATLITGMSIAMYTTLVGSVLALWLTVLHSILVNELNRLNNG